MASPISLRPSHRVFASFALYAFAMGNIFPRIPEVQQGLGVDEGALGLGLIGAPVGTLLSLTFATPILEKVGLKRALVTGICLIAAFYAVAVQAPSVLSLFFLLIPVGMAIGCVEIIVNLEADRTEHMVGYRIMNRSHAFWSIGFFVAGLFGSAMAGLGVSPALHLGIVVPIAAIGVWLCLSDYQPAPPRPGAGEGAAPRFARPTAAIMLLVCVTVSAMLLEGGSLDWSAIYMRDVHLSGPFLSGISVACFAMAQATARFFADAFVERHSPVAVARVLLCLLLAGCILVYLAPSPLLSLVGFALMGVGTSAIFPLAMSAAAQRSDRPAAVNIAALAQISFVVFLLGPPILGLIAEHFGIRASFGIGVPLVLLSLLTAGALGRREALRDA